MANSKNSQKLVSETNPRTFPYTEIFDRSILIALLSLVLLSWFINSFLLT